MKILFLIWALIFTGILGREVEGQENMNLNDCIHYALGNNINLHAYTIQKKIAKEEHHQSFRNLMPYVSASSSSYLNFGRSIDDNTNEYVNVNAFDNDFEASGSVTLFKGFQLKNTIQLNKFLVENAESSEKKASDELVFDVMQAYFDVVYYKEMANIALEQVNTTQLQLKAMERRTALGLNAKSDLLEIQANLQTEQLNLLQMKNQTRSGLMELKELLNYEPDDSLSVQYNAAQQLKPIPAMSFGAYTDKIQNVPRIQVAATNLQAKQKKLAVAKGTLLPTISGYGGIGSAYYKTSSSSETTPFNEQFNNKLYEYVGVSISIPIWNKWNRYSDIKIAKLNYQQAKENLDLEKQTVYYLIKTELQNLQALQKEYEQYQKQLAVNEQAFRVAQKKLDKGLISVVDFYVSKNRLAESKANILRAELQVIIKSHLLDYYQGKRFWETEGEQGENRKQES